MYRFLASRHWLVRIIAGLLLVAACVRLGIWQLDRNDERSERNGRIEAAQEAAPVPIDDALSPGGEFDDGDVWRNVEVSGRYDSDNQFVVQLRPLDGEHGVHVLTPLVTEGGEAILVDRGFYATSEIEVDPHSAPAPSSSDVTAVVRLRASEGDPEDAGDVAARQLRRVNVEAITSELPYPLYPAWGELVRQEPPAAADLTPIPAPETDAGPHLSYAIQWFIFACIGIGGFVFLARAEARGRRELSESSDNSIYTANHDRQEA